MNEILNMVLALLIGNLIGIVFFGGLWLTVKKAMASKIPAVWFAGSFILRIAISLVGLYYVSGGKWQRLLLCLLGFLIARFIVIRLTKSAKITRVQNIKEANHEA